MSIVHLIFMFDITNVTFLFFFRRPGHESRRPGPESYFRFRSPFQNRKLYFRIGENEKDILFKFRVL